MNVYRVLSTSVGHKVYGEEEKYYQDTGDGGNVLSCTGDYNKLDGGADCDDITCNGKKCYVDVRFRRPGRNGEFYICFVGPSWQRLAHGRLRLRGEAREPGQLWRKHRPPLRVFSVSNDFRYARTICFLR